MNAFEAVEKTIAPVICRRSWNPPSEVSYGLAFTLTSFCAAMAKRNPKYTGLLSKGARSTFERSRNGFDTRLVS
jgi:hypothetical protein